MNDMVNDNTSDSPELVLALDFGVKKMGMALGNSITQDARPNDEPSVWRTFWLVW